MILLAIFGGDKVEGEKTGNEIIDLQESYGVCVFPGTKHIHLRS